jgi:hypothetical protein
VQIFTVKFESLHQAFGISEVSVDKLLGGIGTSKNANPWESFVATLGGMHGIGLMQVFAFSQLVSVVDTDGVTRRSKRLAGGKQELGTKRASKRQRSLANAISHKQPNAKSHDSGH